MDKLKIFKDAKANYLAGVSCWASWYSAELNVDVKVNGQLSECPGCGEKQFSLNPDRFNVGGGGCFRASCDVRGYDALQIYSKVHRISQGEALKRLSGGIIQKPSASVLAERAAKHRAAEADAAEKRRKALWLLEKIKRESASAADDPLLKTYFASRGLWVPLVASKFEGYGDSNVYPFPVRNLAGEVVQYQRLSLDEKGGKVGKAMLGLPVPPGSFIELAPLNTSSTLLVGEGVESTMSLAWLMLQSGALAKNSFGCFSLLNTAGMKNFVLPAGVERLIIAADNDETTQGNPGLEAAEVLAAKAQGLGVEVHIRMPSTPKTDWNDVLVQNKS